MPHLRKLVIVILLIFCAASYGSQVNTHDEYICSNHTASYEDYGQVFYTGLLDLLTYLSLYYDEFRLRLRVSEMAAVALVNFYISKTGNAHNSKCITILSMGVISSFLYNTACDISVYLKSDESSLLAISRFIAKRAEHKLFLEVFHCLTRQLFPGLCLICLGPMKDPAVAACAKHWFCEACITEWAKQSTLCSLCH